MVFLRSFERLNYCRIQCCFDFFACRSGTKLEKKNWAPSTRNGKVNRTPESMWTTSTSISTVSVSFVLHLASSESYMHSVTSLDEGLSSNHRINQSLKSQIYKKKNLPSLYIIIYRIIFTIFGLLAPN